MDPRASLSLRDTMSTRRFITVSEVSEILGLHPQTIYDWVSHGKLAVVRLSARCLRIDRQDLEALVTKGKKRPGRG